MTQPPSADRRPLRLWPGVAIVIIQWLLWMVVPVVLPTALIIGVLGAMACGAAILLWWLFFSRAPWVERIGAVVLMVGAVFATLQLLHPSVRRGGMGGIFFLYAIPALSLALVAAAVATRRLSSGVRRASIAAAVLLACGLFTMLRTGGVTGDLNSDFHWRWTPTPEERLLARAANEPLPPPPAPAAAETPQEAPAVEAGKSAAAPAPAAEMPKKPEATEKATPSSAAPAAARTDAEWPGFRGPGRNGMVRGVRIETDWTRKPPVELWRRPVGPGWSSFAVRGDFIYTQEQRGEDEIVSCYHLSNGKPVWRHRDAARFWESNAGPGPRATPTLSDGRVYTHGGTGIVNALAARDGSVVWSRNAGTDTGKQIPGWGFASSPLVLGDIVIVAAAGSLAAYDVAGGKPRWTVKGGAGYSSPHLATINGVTQVLLVKGGGVISVAPADGTVLWNHEWPGDGIVQPAVFGDGTVLIGSGSGMGTGGVGIRRIAVARGSGGWATEERWTSPGLKPYYNDFVVHKDHAFGFDGSILSCIDLKDGKRKWKGGRYGHGQLVLLPEQDLLLVLSEEGELALVRAAPDEFVELAKFQALQSKTWNHPVLVRDVLLVRNGEEMAAFRLSLAGG